VPKAGIVQTRTGLDRARNAESLAAAARRLARAGAAIVFTPEMCGLLDRDSRRLAATATGETDEPTLAALRDVAAEQHVTIAVGSLAIRDGGDRLRNRSFLVGPEGAIQARYDKLHLFDVDLPDGSRYRESATFAPGDAVVAAALDWGVLGLSICYDIRFPALYAALAGAGAGVIAVPSAFTVPTGAAHWHVLLRARAIETGSFLAAAAQAGRHEDGRETFGHSLVVSPWGEVLADLGTEPGELLVDLDLGQVAKARAHIPALGHARPLPAATLIPPLPAATLIPPLPAATLIPPLPAATLIPPLPPDTLAPGQRLAQRTAGVP
jgi:predicted amidohydrolase